MIIALLLALVAGITYGATHLPDQSKRDARSARKVDATEEQQWEIEGLLQNLSAVEERLKEFILADVGYYEKNGRPRRLTIRQADRIIARLRARQDPERADEQAEELRASFDKRRRDRQAREEEQWEREQFEQERYEPWTGGDDPTF